MLEFLKNSRGFSLVEGLVAGVLVVGVGVLSMQQSGLLQDTYRNITGERKSVDLAGQMTHALLVTSNCEATLANSGIASGSTINSIVDGAGTSLYAVGEVYLNNSVAIEAMQVVQAAGGNTLNLKVDFRKTQAKSGMTNFSKFLPLMVRTDGSGQIISCFSFSESIQRTVSDLISKILCADNQGDLDDPADECYVRGFDDAANLSCAPGFSLTRITYFDVDKKFVGECSSTFVANSCPNGWVKRMVPAAAGESNTTFECFNVSASGTARPYNKSCRLQDQGDAFSFSCTGDGLGPCLCAAPSSRCTGTTIMDNCGRACPVGTNDELCKVVETSTCEWIEGTPVCNPPNMVTPKLCTCKSGCSTPQPPPTIVYDPSCSPPDDPCTADWGAWDGGMCSENLPGQMEYNRSCVKDPTTCPLDCQPDSDGNMGIKNEADVSCPCAVMSKWDDGICSTTSPGKRDFTRTCDKLTGCTLECEGSLTKQEDDPECLSCATWGDWDDGVCSSTVPGKRDFARVCNKAPGCSEECQDDAEGGATKQEDDSNCPIGDRAGISVTLGGCPENNNEAYSTWLIGDGPIMSSSTAFLSLPSSAIEDGAVVASGGGDNAYSASEGDTAFADGTYQVRPGSINDTVTVTDPVSGASLDRKRPYSLSVSGGGYSLSGCAVPNPPKGGGSGCSPTPERCEPVAVSCSSLNGRLSAYGYNGSCSNSGGICRIQDTGSPFTSGYCAYISNGLPCDRGSQCASGCCGTENVGGGETILGYCEPVGSSACGQGGSVTRSGAQSSCPGNWIPEVDDCPEGGGEPGDEGEGPAPCENAGKLLSSNSGSEYGCPGTGTTTTSEVTDNRCCSNTAEREVTCSDTFGLVTVTCK